MRTLTLAVVAAVLAVHRTEAAALINADAGEVAEAATYLAKYGYSFGGAAEERSGALVTLSGNIAEFQRFAGLEVTGELDAQTLEKMRQPRCGVKDKLGPSEKARRRKRYALQGSRWRIKNLTFKITSWPKSTRVNKDQVRATVIESFDAWSKVSDLTFKEVQPSERANIEIKFAAGEHGDGDPFDGRGGTLAHAFFPLYGGDAHFDDSEPWSANGRGGIDLFMTAAHEFGHSLGLSHSEDSRALMAPFYKPPTKDRDVIKQDDKAAIQALYGPPKETVKPEKPAEGSSGSSGDKPSNDDILCAESKPDTMITVKSSSSSQYRTYVFKGEKYWRLTETGVEEGYPKNIQDKWDGVPVNLDAAIVSRTNKKLYFFKGSQVWQMNGTSYKLDKGFPKKISTVFPGIPNKLDGAFEWFVNGKLFFFKGKQYWKFEENKNPPVAKKYPQLISIWGGIPNNIDSVMIYSNKKAYFFKDEQYYRYDSQNFRVSRSSIPYPRNTGKWWFGCDNKPASMVTASSHRGDISSGDTYGDAVVGFGEGDAEPRRSGNAAHPLSPPALMLTVTTAVLPLLRLRRI